MVEFLKNTRNRKQEERVSEALSGVAKPLTFDTAFWEGEIPDFEILMHISLFLEARKQLVYSISLFYIQYLFFYCNFQPQK